MEEVKVHGNTDNVERVTGKSTDTCNGFNGVRHKKKKMDAGRMTKRVNLHQMNGTKRKFMKDELTDQIEEVNEIKER